VSASNSLRLELAVHRKANVVITATSRMRFKPLVKASLAAPYTWPWTCCRRDATASDNVPDFIPRPVRGRRTVVQAKINRIRVAQTAGTVTWGYSAE